MKRMILVLFSVILMINNSYAKVKDVGGERITIYMTEEEKRQYIEAIEKERAEHYNTIEVIDLIIAGKFTGIIATGYTTGSYLCSRKDSFGTREPYNPFLEGWWIDDYTIKNKNNPWFNPKYNPLYYLYGITKAQFDAMSKEEQLHQVYINGPAYINRVLDESTRSSVDNVSSGIENINNVKCVSEYPDNYTSIEMQSVLFGKYFNNSINDIEPIEWLVLKKENGEAILLSKYILDGKKYNETNVDVDWETCSLRQWLNNDFYNIAFDEAEKNLIQTVDLVNDGNEKYKIKAGKNTKDKVFLLSFNDCLKYFGEKQNKKLATYGTEYAKSLKSEHGYAAISGNDETNFFFWLRSASTEPYKSPENNNVFFRANDVCNEEYIRTGFGSTWAGKSIVEGMRGVRPAIKVRTQ